MGYLLALICTLFSSSKDLLSKALASEVSGSLSAFASFFFALPYYLVLLAILYLAGFETFAFSEAFLYFVVLRGFIDMFFEWSKMLAFANADISFVVAFLALDPLFLLFLSPLLTGDQVTPQGVAGVVLIVAGVVVSLIRFKGGFLSQKRGIMYAVCAAMLASLLTCVDRLTVKQASPVLAGFSITLVAGLFLLPIAFRKRGAMSRLIENQRAFWSRGFFEVGYMVIKLWALVYLQAPYVTAILKVSILLSILGGKILFDERDFWRRLGAGVLIVSGVLFIITE